MTHPHEVLIRFLSAMEQTVNAGGQLISGLFDLAFLFPAIVCVFCAELLVKLHAWTRQAPALIAPQLVRKEKLNV